MSERWYDGTSAYKLDEYYEYTEKVQEKEEISPSKEKKFVINYRKAAAVLALVFILGIGFLYANVVLIQSSSENDKLREDLEYIQGKNIQTSYEITSGIDLKEVENKALNEFGMQHPESYQNVYVDVVQSDYTKVYNYEADGGFAQSLIDGLKSFIAYID